LRVLSHISVSNVGGLLVDQDLAEYVAQQFQEKHKLDIRKSEKSWVKLLHKCADAKEVLSANKEVNIYVEGIIDGIDLNMIIKREVLEQSSIFKIIREKLQESLDKAGITKDQLHSVEIIGGASRIPLVSKIVKEFYEPAEVGSHINGD
jgi:molecular chaperone DnaK (HSP70)